MDLVAMIQSEVKAALLLRCKLFLEAGHFIPCLQIPQQRLLFLKKALPTKLKSRGFCTESIHASPKALWEAHAITGHPVSDAGV